LDLSADGAYLAVVSKDRQAGDKSIWIWNAHDFTTSVAGYQMNDDVWSVAFSSDGKQLAIGCAAKIILLERETGTLISTIDTPNAVAVQLTFGPNHTLAFSDFNDSVTVWDLTLNKIKYSVNGIVGFEPNHFAISPDGRRLLTSDFSETHVWDYATGQSITTRESPDGGIGVAQALAFSDDGKYLAIGGCSQFNFESCVRGEVSVWESGVLKLDFNRFSTRIRSLAFSTDNRYLAIASAEKEDKVELLDLKSRSLKSFPALAEPVKNPPNDSFSIYDMVFLKEKDELVVSTTDGIQLLEASTLSRVPDLSFRLRLNYPYQITASGDNLNLRTVPSLNGTILQKLHKGDGINTVDGPIFADDFIWWKVKIQDGNEGWITERPGWFQFDP
jgi:WD40 repeat protein